MNIFTDVATFVKWQASIWWTTVMPMQILYRHISTTWQRGKVGPTLGVPTKLLYTWPS